MFFWERYNGLLTAEAYPEPSRISKMELFTKIVKGLKSWTIFATDEEYSQMEYGQIRNRLRWGIQYLTVDIYCVVRAIYKLISKKGNTLLQKRKTTSFEDSKVSVLQNWVNHGYPPLIFPKIISRLLPNTEQKHILLIDGMITLLGAKILESSKISEIVVDFLIKWP